MPRDTFSSRANASTLVQPFSRSTAWSLNSCVYRCHFLIRSSPFSAKVFKARVSHFRGALHSSCDWIDLIAQPVIPPSAFGCIEKTNRTPIAVAEGQRDTRCEIEPSADAPVVQQPSD